MMFLGLKPFGWIFVTMEVALLLLINWLHGRYEVKLTVARKKGKEEVQ